MKPYTDLNGKARWSNFWGDKVKTKIKKIFRKSARRMNKPVIDTEPTCKTCKFNSGPSCTVGSYYAEKGVSAVCFSGELWESK